MKDVKQVLTETRQLLSDPKKWTKGDTGRNAQGSHASALSPDAVSFCLAGAMIHCVGEDPAEEIGIACAIVERAIEQVFPDFEGRYCTTFNDRMCTKHEDILKVLDKALEIADAQRTTVGL